MNLIPIKDFPLCDKQPEIMTWLLLETMYILQWIELYKKDYNWRICVQKIGLFTMRKYGPDEFSFAKVKNDKTLLQVTLICSASVSLHLST